jgi:L-ascorbate metabolism protein UlaG (beta-lactamase superfamily)
MNPDDAGRAFLELGAARMVAIHWGTYKLTDEALDEPPQRLEDWRSRQRVEPERVLVLPVGGRLSL